MTTKDCERILQTMAVGACMTEKEAIEYAIKQMKKAKKAKRWKRKYLTLVKAEPIKKTLNGVFIKLAELGIQDKEYAEIIYSLIHITYEIGFNNGLNERRGAEE